MPNTVTDRLHLVSSSPVNGGNWLFPKTVGVDVGFSLQVFTPTGQWRCEVDDRSSRGSARDGDVILRINLGVQTYPFAGTLPTRDGYPRAYSATLRLRVLLPIAFAIAYRQERDPVEQLRLAIDGSLSRWARQLFHDDISSDAMRFEIKSAALLAQSGFGFEVIDVLAADVALNTHFAKIIDIQRHLDLDQHQGAANAIRAEDQRVEQARENQFRRDTAVQDAGTNIQITQMTEQAKMLLQAQQQITTTMTEQYTARLRDLMAQGLSLAEMYAQDPELFKYMAQLAGPVLTQPALAAPSSSSQSSGAIDIFATVTSGGQSTAQPSYDSLLGIYIVQGQLSQAQSDIVQSYTIQQVYTITQVNTNGLADRAGLAIGDIILQVEDRPLLDHQSISTLARGAPAGGQASVLVLRNVQLIRCKATINHP